MFGVTFVGTAAGESHYIDSAYVGEARGGARRVMGPLHTEGNRLVDSRGATLILRGVNRAGLESGNGNDYTVDELAHAQAWGANVVRIPLGEQLWLPTSCQYDPNFVNRVDNAVKVVTDLGMVALLNLHWSQTTRCGEPGLVPGADDRAPLFWQQVASRYKNNPLVAFDLYNEPHHLTPEIWRDGGNVTWQGVTYKVTGMQQMYDAVRSTGATNVVTISGNSWANVWPKTVAPITGNNIVYAIHLYTCATVPPPDCKSTAPYDVAPWLNPWLTPGQSYPLMVTEFGWPDPQNGLYQRSLIAYAEAQGWGWAAYTWGNTWGQFSLLATAGPGKNYQPKPSGMPILAAYPGN